MIYNATQTANNLHINSKNILLINFFEKQFICDLLAGSNVLVSEGIFYEIVVDWRHHRG